MKFFKTFFHLTWIGFFLTIGTIIGAVLYGNPVLYFLAVEMIVFTAIAYLFMMDAKMRKL